MRSGFVGSILACFILAFAGLPAAADPIHGAGSTFAYPIIAKWSQAYKIAQIGDSDFVSQDDRIDYEPIGSLGGIMRLGQPEIDFAASDVPLPPEELTKLGYVQFPIVMGGLAPVINLDGIEPGALKLTGPLLADIYLGKIQNWSDPAIQAVNAGLPLPDLRINVIHRSDGSGSTYNWTSFLSAASAEWKSKYGADTLISWPLGTSVEGSSGMVAKVRETKGAIGYAEYGQLTRASLNYASVQNPAGQFVRPEPQSFQAAAAHIDWVNAQDFHVSLVNAAGADAYPITAATFIIMQQTPRSSSRLRQTLWFFSFAIEQGAGDAAALGYVPLPETLVSQVKAYWANKFKFGS